MGEAWSQPQCGWHGAWKRHVSQCVAAHFAARTLVSGPAVGAASGQVGGSILQPVSVEARHSMVHVSGLARSEKTVPRTHPPDPAPTSHTRIKNPASELRTAPQCPHETDSHRAAHQQHDAHSKYGTPSSTLCASSASLTPHMLQHPSIDERPASLRAFGCRRCSHGLA